MISWSDRTMKLHIARDWVRRFEDKEIEPASVAGAIFDVESTLSSLQKELMRENWRAFPIAAIARLGWIDAVAEQIRRNTGELADTFLDSIRVQVPVTALWRGPDVVDGETFQVSLLKWLWVARLAQQSTEVERENFDRDFVTAEFAQVIAQFSPYEDGPHRAKRFLAQHGIVLLIEPALPGSRLDGAAFLSNMGNPVIGLSLRFDRIDYFWFTLLHEIGHLALHVHGRDGCFVETVEGEGAVTGQLEQEANFFAQEALVPRALWRRSAAYRRPSAQTFQQLANELGISRAIVAGRFRRDRNRYDLFSDLVGQGELRRMFPQHIWQ